LKKLRANKIPVKVVEPIENPFKGRTRPNWKRTYSKIRIFEQTELAKIVYLDADTIICKNIDELFDKPHMAAVNSLGMLQEHSHVLGFNAGMMVIEPAKVDAKDMIGKIGKIEGAKENEEGFLNAYFPDWPKRQELHLDPKFNMFYTYLDRYHQVFGYRLPKDTNASEQDEGKVVSVLHFIGLPKPWSHMPLPLLSWRARRAVPTGWRGPLSGQSLKLWRDFRKESQNPTR
jgi:glycogenin glucosyltransferase